jgi:gas vesicle protein
MADPTFTEKNSSSPATPGVERAAGATMNAADQAMSAGRDLKEKEADVANSSAEKVKDQASQFIDTAKERASDMASQAADRLKETVDGQKNAGAQYVSGIAEAMRRAARELDNDLPIAGTYMRKAASQVEGVSESVRNGDFNDLLRNAQDFARRQPTAILGLAVLAGFGAVRFLKSSAQNVSDGGSYKPQASSSYTPQASSRVSGQSTTQHGTFPSTDKREYNDGLSN